MTSKLEIINKKKLEEIHFIEDYTQLYFSNKAILNIYNNFTTSKNLSDFKNLQVTSIKENDKLISIKFEGNEFILIDMRDEAYNSPEALQLNTPEGQTIIWN